MKKLKWRDNIVAILVIFTMFIFCAFVDNARGVIIPLFKSDFSVNDTKIGYMLTIANVGYFTFTFIGGAMCEKFGQRKVYILGFTSSIVALLMLSNTYSFFMLIASMCLLNVGLSLISIATNTLVPVLFLSFQAILMNMTHFCYGLGATIGQRVSGMLVSSGVNWRTIYLIGAILFTVLFIIFMLIKVPEPARVTGIAKNQAGGNVSSFANKKILIFYLFALGFYSFCESGTVNWFVNYMIKSYGYNENKGSIYLSLFFGIFSVGRLLGGFIVEKVGYLRSVLVSLIVAAILYASGILMGERGLTLISFAGLFFSISYPTMVLSVSKVFRENSSYVIGIIITFSTITSMVLNLFISYLNVAIGAHNAYFMIPVSLSVSILFVYLLSRDTKEFFSKGDSIGEKCNC